MERKSVRLLENPQFVLDRLTGSVGKTAEISLDSCYMLESKVFFSS